jgi:hypothetical protein
MWLKAEAEGRGFWIAAESVEFFMKIDPFGSMVTGGRLALLDF